MPNFSAHSAEIVPIGRSAVYVFLNNLSLKPDRSGSSLVRNSSEGNPSNSSCQSALCPAAHRERLKVNGSVFPDKTAETQSQCSTHENAFSRTFSSTLKVRRIFAQYHSDE